MRIRTLMILVALLPAHNISHGQHYYGTSGSIQLQYDTLRALVKFDPTIPAPQVEDLVNQIPRIIDLIPFTKVIDGFVACSLAAAPGYEEFIDSLNQREGIYLAEPFLLGWDSTEYVIGESFVVAFDSTLTAQQIDSINSEHNVVMKKPLLGMSNVFVLRNTDSSDHRLLNIANLYHQLAAVRYAHPDFVSTFVKTEYKSYDYYARKQDHLKKIIGAFNLASAWDFAGLKDTIVVAVIDDGVTAHEDFQSWSLLDGYDFNADDDTVRWDENPTPGYDQGHGMACAGIIGASHTNDTSGLSHQETGIVSMNSRVKVLPVKIFNDEGYAGVMPNSTTAEAVNWAVNNGADVLSNSWGWQENEFDVPELTEAIQNAVLYGRGGKGCPTIFSSGNGGDHIWNAFDSVGYPANLAYTLAVGAVDLSDWPWSYSQHGSKLDLVAPSGQTNHRGDVWTLDQMWYAGVNPNDTGTFKSPITWDCGIVMPNNRSYNCKFGGTSASCAFVSGTASLLLSKNPDLSSFAVYDILKRSAVKIWDDTTTMHHPLFGYGRVDAFRAVLSISRGNIDNDSLDVIDVGDFTYLISYLYESGPEPFPSLDLANLDCDSLALVDIADLTVLVSYLYHSGAPPVNPCFVFREDVQ